MSKKSRKLLEKFEYAAIEVATCASMYPGDEAAQAPSKKQYKLAKANLAAHLIVLEEMAKGSF